VLAFRTARSTELTSLNLNANSAALFLNGSAGAIRTFANLVTKNKSMATMFLGKQRVNCQSALVLNYVPLNASILIMVKNSLLDVQYAEMKLQIRGTFEYSLLNI
jgi:hypothetical protein